MLYLMDKKKRISNFQMQMIFKQRLDDKSKLNILLQGETSTEDSLWPWIYYMATAKTSKRLITSLKKSVN